MSSYNIEISEKLHRRAVEVMPGGVNSPVRAFGSVGGTPRFIEKAKGQYIYDVDGNKYIDYIGSWGPMVLGHNDDRVIEAVSEQINKGLSFGASTKIEVEMAEFICDTVSCVEMIRMVNSGTEAVMSAIRAARGYTQKEKIIKFAGCYHGHSDALLVKAGSGAMTVGVPNSGGVPNGCVKDTLTAVYNELESVQMLFNENKNQIACIIVEPVAANMGLISPSEGFLEGLRKICTENNAVLIFDEVITGFRLGIDGAAGFFGIEPDIVTYGKVIGGGMPVGAYGGKKDIMKTVAPLGNVYQAGTLSGNPVAMTAGLTQLKILKQNPDIYKYINELGEKLRTDLKKTAEDRKAKVTVNGVGSLSCVYFNEEPVFDYETANASDIHKFAKYFNFMLERGNYFGPSQFEAIFISASHLKTDIEKTVCDFCDFLTVF